MRPLSAREEARVRAARLRHGARRETAVPGPRWPAGAALGAIAILFGVFLLAIYRPRTGAEDPAPERVAVVFAVGFFRALLELIIGYADPEGRRA